MSDALAEIVHIRRLDQAKTALHPVRIDLLQLLREPRTCAQLAKTLGMSAQRVNNHLKVLLEASLIRVVSTRQVRNLTQATYQAVGKVIWLAPTLMRDEAIADQAFRDRLSLHNLIVMAETVTDDVAGLLGHADAGDVPSLGITVEINLRSEAERHRFTKDVLDALVPVLERYQGPDNPEGAFTLHLMCYPQEGSDV